VKFSRSLYTSREDELSREDGRKDELSIEDELSRVDEIPSRRSLTSLGSTAESKLGGGKREEFLTYTSRCSRCKEARYQDRVDLH
jgi:hypothetical protein